MSIPINRIEIYHGASKIYTLDNEAINIHTKQNLNAVGTWNFSLATKKNGDFEYYDIVPYDIAKIYLGYNTVPASPTLVGRICRITAPFDTSLGYVRAFEGKDQAEILERRVKPAKYWYLTDASDIVTELAEDLGLGTGDINTEDQDLTFFTEDETYLDILQKVSDFWVDGGTQLKKDWYVDAANNLVWGDRPIGTGSETLTIGENVKSYSVLNDAQSVKNYFKVYGEYADEAHVPADDSFSDSLDEWSKWVYGSVDVEGTDKKVGTYSIKGSSEESGGQHYLGMQRTLLPIEETAQCIKQYCNDSLGQIHFWAKCSVTTTMWFNLLGDGPGTNLIGVDLVANTWREVTLAFGEDNYGYGWMWGKEPEVFTNIDSIGFSFDAQGSAFTLLIDDLYFMKCKWRGSAEDSGGGSSQALYGQRDTYYVDDTLKSNADCTSRAERLLYQQKSLPNRIDMEVKGNTAIGVGDRLSLTIPAEDIPPTNYDVLSVEHNFLKGGGLTTSASFINSGDIRALPPAVPNDSIRKHFDVQREVGKGLRVIK